MTLLLEMKNTKTKPKVRVVSRKVKKEDKNFWIEEDLSEYIHEFQSTPVSSIWGSAKKYGFRWLLSK